jgi:hypothetical protein
MKNFTLNILASILVSVNCFAQQINIDSSDAITDQQLLSAAANEEFKFYKGDDSWLKFTPRGGGHSGFIRIKFNAPAQSVLDESGNLPVGGVFPAGSLVIKEIKDKIEDSWTILSIMLKSANAPNANQGWVWGEYEPNGDPIVSASSGGKSCIRCHSITNRNSPVAGDRGHRDFVRTFGLRE